MPHHNSGIRRRVTDKSSRCLPTLRSKVRTSSEGYQGLPSNSSRLESILRSESHQVFVQPVKELVVKKWKDFRRPFGNTGSSYALASGSSDSEDQIPASDYGQSLTSTPTMSSDAGIRRLRAQEKGEIHSARKDSATHYNSPASGSLTPIDAGLNIADWIESVDSANTTPTFPLADPVTAAAEWATAEIDSQSPSSSQESILTRADHLRAPSPYIPTRGQPIVMPGLAISGNQRQEHNPASFLHPHNTKSRRWSQAFSDRRIQFRQRRKSMLSEVFTPDDMQDDSAEARANSQNRSLR